MAFTAGDQLGRYEIRSKIGEGGMGEVYLADDLRLDRKVALKILPADLASKQERMVRFVREAKAAAATMKTATCLSSAASPQSGRAPYLGCRFRA